MDDDDFKTLLESIKCLSPEEMGQLRQELDRKLSSLAANGAETDQAGQQPVLLQAKLLSKTITDARR